jgi:hypothetical protein
MTTRREVLIGIAGMALVPACGPAGGGSPDAASSGPMCSSMIANNHGHVLTVPPSDLAAPADHDFDIHGSADHTHTVTITAAQFSLLAGGGTLSVTWSIGGGHTHACMVHCTT